MEKALPPPLEGRRFRKLFGGALIVLYLVLYILPLGVRPLFVPDEARYAEIAWEMVAEGDWTRLLQADLRYYEKPPLGYWINAASISAFGRTPFAVRFPTALAAGLAALALYGFVRHVRGDATRALLAAGVFLSSALVFGVGTFATLDSMFAAFVAASMFAFYLSLTARGPARLGWGMAAGVACAAAFLTKGFVAFVFPALAAAAWLAWERRWRELATCWIVPVATALVAMLPAAVVVHANNPDFWNYFFWTEHVQRFLSPSGGQHREPFWYFVPVLAATAIPWSFFLPAAVPEIRTRAGRDPATRYGVCWFVAGFVFLSACGGKLATYLLPLFPPLAMLVADALVDCPREARLRRSAWAGVLLLALALAGFLGWAFFDPRDKLRLALMSPPEKTLLPLAFAPTLVFLGLAAAAFRDSAPASRRRLRAVAWTAASVASIFFASFHALPRSAEDNKSPSRLLEWAVPETPPHSLLVTDHTILPAVCWHYEEDDVLLFDTRGELGYGVEYWKREGDPDPEDAGLPRYARSADDAAALLRERLAAGRPVAVILRQRFFDKLAAALPDLRPARERSIRPYVWALYRPASNGTAAEASAADVAAVVDVVDVLVGDAADQPQQAFQ